jgi:NAD(P)-dependent dehydrogenase (short-subunit alcohol dehydrogenase family)
MPGGLTVDGYDLTGRRVLVTGAEHDAGRATALALESAGATVVLADTADVNGNGTVDVVVNLTTLSGAERGLSGLTRSLARQLGPDGVRVNLVAATPDSCPEHVAAVALFLASTGSGGVNGETIVVATGR